jgi:hypothetical protein
MTFISGDIAMEVEMPGGLAGGLKRKLLAGESLFVTFRPCPSPAPRGGCSRPPGGTGRVRGRRNLRQDPRIGGTR